MFPKQNGSATLLAIVSRESFIKNTINGEWFKKQHEPQKQIIKPRIQNDIIIKRREPTHYYDPRKGRFIKKWQF